MIYRSLKDAETELSRIEREIGMNADKIKEKLDNGEQESLKMVKVLMLDRVVKILKGQDD